MIIKAVEEPALLPAMYRIVGRVEVEDQLGRRAGEAGDEPLDEHLVDGPGGRPVGAVLEPAQRRRARQHAVPLNGGLPRRIPAQRSVVVQILVSQRDAKHPLAQQIDQPMPAARRITIILEPRRHRRQQPELAIRLPQQQHTAIARDIPAGKFRLDPTPTAGWKPHPLLDTICHGEALRPIQSKHLNRSGNHRASPPPS